MRYIFAFTKTSLLLVKKSCPKKTVKIINNEVNFPKVYKYIGYIKYIQNDK